MDFAFVPVTDPEFPVAPHLYHLSDVRLDGDDGPHPLSVRSSHDMTTAPGSKRIQPFFFHDRLLTLLLRGLETEIHTLLAGRQCARGDA